MAANNEVELRDATTKDVEQIADIWRHYVIHSNCNLEDKPPNTEEIRQDLKEIFDKNYPFIVAVKDDALCGYAYAGPFNARSGYQYCCEDSIYLLPSYAGKGLGTRMLKELVQRLKVDTNITQVLAKISIPVGAGLEDVASCRLHLSLGFREVGRLRKVGYKFGEWLDVVILQLDLAVTRQPTRP